MRVCIVAMGTRGDLEPSVALARGLQAHGHQPRLAADPMFEPFVTQHAIEFVPIRTNSKELSDTGLLRGLFEGKGTKSSSWRAFSRVTGATVHQRFVDCLQACGGADVIVASRIAVLLAYSVAERLRLPLVRVDFAPPTQPTTRAFASARLNRWSDYVYWHCIWNLFRRATNRARRDVLQLPPLPILTPVAPLNRRGAPILCAYSEHVCPSSNMPPWMHVTGYWFLDGGANWQPPRELAAFLDAGPLPVYVGFGSMKHSGAKEMAEMVVAALTRAGQRGIVATGWDSLRPESRSKDIYTVDDVPHDWLFPRVAAVVHHGGAGTTAAGLRAGRPTVVVPSSVLDQPFWGERVHDLGVGPPPIARNRLTVERLGTAIAAVARGESFRCRAVALGARIRGEDGVRRAIDIITRVNRDRKHG